MLQLLRVLADSIILPKTVVGLNPLKHDVTVSLEFIINNSGKLGHLLSGIPVLPKLPNFTLFEGFFSIQF